jgi:hypothetical protein
MTDKNEGCPFFRAAFFDSTNGKPYKKTFQIIQTYTQKHPFLNKNYQKT